jgi:transcriptional regulator with XRE-family HTH domain
MLSIERDTKIYLWTPPVSSIRDVPEFDAKKFGSRLRARREELRYSVTELAEMAEMSKQYLSRLERAEEQLLTNKPTQPALNKVEKLAVLLRENVDEFRELAGYGPRNGHRDKPQNAAEFAERLREMGFEIQTDFDWEIIGPDQLQETIEMIEDNLIRQAKRLKKEAVNR